MCSHFPVCVSYAIFYAKATVLVPAEVKFSHGNRLRYVCRADVCMEMEQVSVWNRYLYGVFVWFHADFPGSIKTDFGMLSRFELAIRIDGVFGCSAFYVVLSLWICAVEERHWRNMRTYCDL